MRHFSRWPSAVFLLVRLYHYGHSVVLRKRLWPATLAALSWIKLTPLTSVETKTNNSLIMQNLSPKFSQFLMMREVVVEDDNCSIYFCSGRFLSIACNFSSCWQQRSESVTRPDEGKSMHDSLESHKTVLASIWTSSQIMEYISFSRCLMRSRLSSHKINSFYRFSRKYERVTVFFAKWCSTQGVSFLL